MIRNVLNNPPFSPSGLRDIINDSFPIFLPFLVIIESYVSELRMHELEILCSNKSCPKLTNIIRQVKIDTLNRGLSRTVTSSNTFGGVYIGVVFYRKAII